MSRALLLPPQAWRPIAAGVEALLPASAAIWAEGWPEAAAGQAHLLAGDGTARPFAWLGATAFAAAGGCVAVRAPLAPARCLLLGPAPAGHSPTLAAFWPRALGRPARPAPPDPASCRARLDLALAEGELDAALAPVGEMLLLDRAAPETRAAVAVLLAHLARHPLDRSPALGLLVAALTE